MSAFYMSTLALRKLYLTFEVCRVYVVTCEGSFSAATDRKGRLLCGRTCALGPTVLKISPADGDGNVRFVKY